MADDVEDLITQLTVATSMLENVKEEFWAKWLQENLNMIRQRNFRGVERLLSGFGGMGSFTDLVIHPINGHEILESQISSVNEQFAALRTKLYHLAIKIKHEVESE